MSPPPDAPLPRAQPEAPAAEPEASPVGRWLKRFGVAGFLFFLVKGLLWLIVPALLIFFGC